MATIQESLRARLEAIALHETTPFCYACYRATPNGSCPACGSDDLMRLFEGRGVDYGLAWVLPILLREGLAAVDVEEVFQERMDELYPDDVNVCGILMDPVRILRGLDEATWHQEFLAWLFVEVKDGRLVSFDDERTYYHVDDVEAWLDARLDDEAVIEEVRP